MFRCHSCMRRLLNIIPSESASIYRGPPIALILSGNGARRRRNNSAALDAIVEQPQIRFARRSATEAASDTKRRVRRTSPVQKENNEASDVQRPRNRSRSSDKNTTSLTPWAVERHLTYLKDPLKLAESVKQLLHKSYADAEALVRAASKSMPCSVSWNHLIRFHMSEGKVSQAVKTYNEMKKRGQTPDAYTFTLLFTGFADHAHYPKALAKALALYHSLGSQSSPIKPNIKHTNAVLQVCARAGDMDALFGITAKMPQRGFGSPDRYTYTTILNAILQNAMGNKLAVRDQRKPWLQKAVLDGRRMWDEIGDRWYQGDISLDERLVCTMGRLLLLGEEYRDLDDIFKMLKQTMDIAYLAPSVNTAETVPQITRRNQSHNNDPASSQTGDLLVEEELIANTSLLGNADGTKSNFGLTPGGEFTKTSSTGPPTKLTKRSFVFVRPGQQTLSLVLESAVKLKRMKIGMEYWQILTREYGIEPDAANYHSYLRLLRLARASRETLVLLQQAPRHLLQEKTFIIAMSTCKRDNKNVKALETAGKIVDLMAESDVGQSSHVLKDYINLAIKTPAGADAKDIESHRILLALERVNIGFLDADVQPLRKMHSGQPIEVTSYSQEDSENHALALQMIAAYDIMIQRGLVRAKDHDHGTIAPIELPDIDTIAKRRKKLAIYISNFNPPLSSSHHRSSHQADVDDNALSRRQR